MEYRKVCKSFSDLSPIELYEIIRLRVEIFIIEQNCIFQDLDNKDQHCQHLMLYNSSNELIAYARLVPAGVAYEEMSIGRVVTSTKARGTGAGKLLMQSAIDLCYQFFGNGPIRIGAQLYARKFYEGVGFRQAGDVYLEDGIEHIEMIKP